ncbi:MAG: FG-GAP-like repeat-containing protein, partial [Ilumatobacter sp.]
MSADYGAYTRIIGRIAVLIALTAAATLVATHSGGAAAAAAAFDGGTDITTTADGAQSVVAADLDGDGDIDLAAASFEDDTISWYSNNGSGSFTASIVTTSANGAQSVTAGDFDGDGDIDLASASLLDDTIAWYPNAGSGSFGLAFDIDTNADGASAVIAADLDGDGDIDLASASRYDDTIAWYENNGGGLFTASDIATSADVASSVTAADLDGDGDIDLASASYVDDTIAWYQNDGTGSFTATDISTSANGARSVIAADLDGDGDVDLASASYVDDKIAWYQNNGAGFFSPSTVSTSADGASAVTAADFDDDGDIDLASASSNDSKIAWYENDGAGSFTATTIATSANGAQAVAAADYDNDGDIDLASASYFDDTIAWYENSVGVDAGGPYELEDGASIALQATTNAPPGTTLTLTWDFDDDGSYDDAAGYTPTFDSTVFGVVGVNTVSVRATDGGALTVFDTTTVKINVDPVVDAGGPYTLDVNATLVLAATAADADGGTPAVVWDLDDDGAFDDATGLTPTFDPALFGSPGINTVTVQATDDEGVVVTDTATVTITTDPIVDPGGPYSAEPGTTIALAATTSDADGGTPTLAWDFDDDGAFDDATGLTPTFDTNVFGSIGVNTITVRATDDEGATAVVATTVAIGFDPLVDAGGPYMVDSTTTVSLVATASDPDGGTPTLAWDFDGDGQFDDAAGLTPTFDPSLFGSPGSNTVAVRATDDEGVTATDTATVTIETDPVVDPGGPYTVADTATVALAAITSDPDGGTSTLAWDFDGDGQFDDAAGLTPTFDTNVFGAPGSNTISVQATDDEGATTVETTTVTITNDPIVD